MKRNSRSLLLDPCGICSTLKEMLKDGKQGTDQKMTLLFICIMKYQCKSEGWSQGVQFLRFKWRKCLNWDYNVFNAKDQKGSLTLQACLLSLC